MGFVEEENELGLVEVAGFRQLLEKFGQHPEQEGGIECRRLNELVGGKDVDDAAPVFIDFHQVVDVEHRFAEEDIAALLFQRQQTALDGADGGRGDIAVFGGEVLGVVADVLDHGAQVFQVEQHQSLIVGNLEHQLQHATLRVVEVEQAREEQRPHVGNSGADGNAALTEDIPEGHGIGVGGKAFQAKLGDAFQQLFGGRASGAHAGQVAFDVRHEDRHARVGKAFGHRLQGDCLAGTGGAGDQAVAVGHLRQQGGICVFGFGKIEWFGHGGQSPAENYFGILAMPAPGNVKDGKSAARH